MIVPPLETHHERVDLTGRGLVLEQILTVPGLHELHTAP